MATIPTPPTSHTTWCDPTECTTTPDGQTVHRSAAAVFDFDESRVWTASMLAVHLVEPVEGEGIQVSLSVQGAVVASYRMTLIPTIAAELGEALLDHAERAIGLSRS